MPAYINISKKKKKHKPITRKKKTLGTVEIKVKMLWTLHFFYLFDL